MAYRTLQSFDLERWDDDWGTADAKFVLALDHDIINTEDGTQFLGSGHLGAGSLRQLGPCFESTITVAGVRATTTAIELPTTDSASPAHLARYYAYIYVRGQLKHRLNDGWHLHEAVNGTSETFTWRQWRNAQNFRQHYPNLPTLGDRITLQEMIDAALAANLVQDASASVKGVTRLSRAPLSASAPIAAGDNDYRFNARFVYAEQFAGATLPVQIQAAVDYLFALGGGTVYVATCGADFGNTVDASQVRVKANVRVVLPQGDFTYSLRGYGGKNMGGGFFLIGGMFVLDSDSCLEGSGPNTRLHESSWVYTELPAGEQAGAVSNGEFIAQHKVVLATAEARTTGSTSRNITVRNLSIVEGKPNQASGFNSAGGCIDLGNCHGGVIEGCHFKDLHSIACHIGSSSSTGSDPGFDLVARGVSAPLGKYAEHVTVRNCFFYGCSSQNLALVNGKGVYFRDNDFRDPGYDSPHAAGTSVIDLEPNAPGDWAEDVYIKGNTIANSTRTWPSGTRINNAIVVQNSASAQGWQNVVVSDNEIFGGKLSVLGHGINGAGILVRNNCDGVRVLRNYVERCQYGITVDYASDDAILFTNLVVSCGNVGATSVILDGSRRSRVLFNAVTIDSRSALAAGEDYDIAELATTSGTPTDNWFVGNLGLVRHLDPSTAPVRRGNFGPAGVVGITTANGYDQLNSVVYTLTNGDATPSVLFGNHFRTANAGATTITAFDDGAAGQSIRLHVADNNTTLQQGAALALVGGATRKLVSGDVVDFAYDGAVWREVGGPAHVVGGGAAPSAAAGGAVPAGSGATASLTGVDAGGEVTLNTGTGILDVGAVLAVTFSSQYASAPAVGLHPSNAAAAALASAGVWVFATATASGFTVSVDNAQLTDSTTYKWHFQVIGR